MKRAIAIVVCWLVLASAAWPANLSDDPSVASRIELLDHWIRAQMEYSGLPGLVIGIVHDQELVWMHTYGHANVADEVPMETDSIFRIASHSKLFTSIAIMQLRDAGKLRLNDRVVKYLPWFDIEDKHPDSPPITIWHLLTHSSGIPRESIHPAWTDFEFPTLEQVKETVSEQETTYPREDRFKYSNLGLSLAGMIVTEVSGRPYKEYVESEILKPLQMDSTSVGVPSPDTRNVSSPATADLCPTIHETSCRSWTRARLIRPQGSLPTSKTCSGFCRGRCGSKTARPAPCSKRTRSAKCSACTFSTRVGRPAGGWASASRIPKPVISSDMEAAIRAIEPTRC